MSMGLKGWIMLRVLLNRFHKGSIETLLHPLPEEDIHKILSVNIDSDSVHPAVANPSERLGSVHFSWLLEVLKAFPQQLQPYALASLSQGQQAGLKSAFTHLISIPKSSEFSSRFFRHLIYHQLGLNEVLPLEYTPSEKLKVLTKLSREELLMLIDLLGVYDLVPEIRQMISKKKMNAIFQALPLNCQKYLKQALYEQDKIPPLSLELEMWEGDRKTLLKSLHRSGLRRLALSLAGCDSTILWHLLHRLDTGRSAYIQTLRPLEFESGISDAAMLQVLKLLKFIESKEVGT